MPTAIHPRPLARSLSRLMGRAPMLRVAIALSAGIVAANLLPAIGVVPLWILLSVCVALLLLSAFVRVKWLSRMFPVVLWAFFIGLGYLVATHHRTDPSDGLPAGGWGDMPGGQVLFQVRLDDTPRRAPKTYKVPAHVEHIWHHGTWLPARCPILLYIHIDSLSASLRYADRLTVQARPQLPDSGRNPHQFDYRRHLLRKGIAWQAYVAHGKWQLQPRSATPHPRLRAWAKQLQLRLVRRLQSTTLSPQHKGMAAALLLGWRDDLDDLTLLHFRQAGIIHLLCVSGLHVGLVAWMAGLLFFPLGRLRWQRVLKGSVQLAAIWGFAFITGLAPSTLRAAVMFTLLVLGNIIQRRPVVLNNLAASAVLLLLLDPNLLYDVGFQLSYTAVLGILVWQDSLWRIVAPPTEKWWYRPARTLYGSVAITFAAQLFTAPLQLYYFHSFSCWFFIANLLIVPFAGLLLATVLAVVALPLASPVGQGCVWLLSHELAAVDGVARWVAGLPGATFSNLYCDGLLLLLLFVALLLFTFFLHSRVRWSLPAASAALMLAAVYLTAVNGRAVHQHEVVIYDAGKRMAVECFDGRHSYLVCDREVAHNPSLVRYEREGSLLHHRTQSTIVLPADTVFDDGRCQLAGGILCFGNESVDINALWPHKRGSGTAAKP